MPDLAYIVYIDPDPHAAVGLPSELQIFQSFCWKESAYIRWHVATTGQVAATLPGNVILVIVDCSADLDGITKTCEEVRAVCQSPVLLVLPTGSAGHAVPVPEVSGTSGQLFRGQLSDENAIEQVLQKLEVPLPAPEFHLDYNKHHPAMAEIVQWISEDRLKLTIQKFFPSASTARVMPVAGGWSGARLCRLFVQGNEYFLKFFEKSEKYIQEHNKHTEAAQWLALSDAAVELQHVPDVDTSPQSQMAAFPQAKPVAFPVCYVSASPPGQHRETLKELYQTKNDRFLNAAFKNLLDALDTGQPDPPIFVDDVPWGFQAGANPFFLDRIKMRVLEALDDLDRYGPSLCGGSMAEWEKRRDKLELIALGKLPDWLAANAVKVACGLSHGDPNPRNCLVLPHDPKNLRLIDCGDFQPSWRLVSDLAQVEREIKLVLMGTEGDALYLYDLDTARFQEWCEAERNAIAHKMAYGPANAPVSGNNPWITAARAYHLIGMVRQRAKKFCAKANDTDGVHYFAALLFWTLDVLRYKEIRRTKRLLALYSASEILLNF